MSASKMCKDFLDQDHKHVATLIYTAELQTHLKAELIFHNQSFMHSCTV